MTTSSVFTTGVLAVATAADLSVPDDMKVASAIDGPLAEFAEVLITGLHINAQNSTEVMIGLLERQIGGEPPPESIPRITSDLIHRRST